jgi:integrase
VAGQSCAPLGDQQGLKWRCRPAEDLSLASWLPELTGLTPHGLRHGHQTWMDEDRIADVLRSERMGHEIPGMRGVYSHVSAAMRAELSS